MSNQTATSQKIYGRVAGAALVLICLIGVLSNNLVVAGDAPATARNILGHELQYRVGVAGELIMLNSDVLLAVALYALLRPVSAPLALLGAFWRLCNAIVLAVGVTVSLVAVDMLKDAHYLTAFGVDQMQDVARAFLDVHGNAAAVGLVCFGLGAGVHSYLLWKSRCIPRVLSGLYFLVAAEVAMCSIAIIVSPALDALIDPWFILPDFVIELAVGLWLLIKGVNVSALDGSKVK